MWSFHTSTALCSIPCIQVLDFRNRDSRPDHVQKFRRREGSLVNSLPLLFAQVPRLAEHSMGVAGLRNSPGLQTGQDRPRARPKPSLGGPHHLLRSIHPGPGFSSPPAAGADPTPHHHSAPRPACTPSQAALTLAFCHAGRDLL